jgi:RNA polymerase sigma-70 factor (ECF subfamily)
MDLKEEKNIVLRAQRDSQEFGLLFDEYYPKILNYVSHRVASIMLAEDITSETFYIALNKLWQFRWKGISFSAWLYRIATNLISQHYRNHYKKPTFSLDNWLEKTDLELVDDLDLGQELVDAEEELQRHSDFVEVQKKLQQLPEYYQTVITLRYFEDKKIKEIADILGKKEGTIKSLLSRGLDLLRH